MRRSLVILAFLALLGAAHAQDADTVKFDGKTFRLDGIDAPEIDQGCLDDKGAPYPCGRVAAQALAKLVAEQTPHCEDRGEDTRYKNQRIGVCHVADGTEINRWLVQQGWALNFEPSAKGRFKADEDEARAGGRGMWKGCFVAPQDFRRWNKKTATLLGSNCASDARDKLFPDDPPMPPGCAIKGKYAMRAWPYLGIYHVPDCGSYGRTSKPERWFCSEEDAAAADFRRSLTCWLK
jgi:endonuclease YncB( thermonuclease family)